MKMIIVALILLTSIHSRAQKRDTTEIIPKYYIFGFNHTSTIITIEEYGNPVRDTILPHSVGARPFVITSSLFYWRITSKRERGEYWSSFAINPHLHYVFHFHRKKGLTCLKEVRGYDNIIELARALERKKTTPWRKPVNL